jgi:hypothetical protein
MRRHGHGGGFKSWTASFDLLSDYRWIAHSRGRAGRPLALFGRQFKSASLLKLSDADVAAAGFLVEVTLASSGVGVSSLPCQNEKENKHGEDGKLRVVARAFVGAVLLMDLCGCPGMGPKANARFQAVVAKNVSVGMPFVTGIEHLVKAGFSCDDRVSAPAVSCSRERQSLLPYVCVQGVNLRTDADRKTIVEVIPKPIGCAGL